MNGVLKLKNVSGSPYAVEELSGVVVADQETIDLLDPALPQFYMTWEDANRLVTELTGAKLYQDIQAGDIEVTESQPSEF